MAILLGRTRTTDDVDVIDGEKDAVKVYERCRQCGFVLLTPRGELEEEYATASVRFYKPPNLLPTFEIKPPRTPPQI